MRSSVFVRHLIKQYLEDYATSQLRRVIGGGILVHYADLIEHTLHEANLVPHSVSEVGEHLRKIYGNVPVAEIGCRNGVFLHFIKGHGGVVHGSTSSGSKGENYLEASRNLLGGKVNIVEANAQQAGWKMTGLKPAIVYSLNLFDANRWVSEECPKDEIIKSFAALASPGTKFYVHPSQARHSVLLIEDLEKHGIKPRVMSSFTEGMEKQPKYVTLAFEMPKAMLRRKRQRK